MGEMKDRIGDLKESASGTHYYGISTAGFNLTTNGCASVQLAQSPSLATTAYSMFAVVKDTNNLYRWYQSGDELVVAERASGPLGYVVLRVTDEGEHVLARLLPRGDVGCDGHVHVPPLSPEMIETLRALLFGSQHRPGLGTAVLRRRRHLPPRCRKQALRQRA